MNEQQTKGAWTDTKGKVKEGIGDLTDDERLQREGELDQAQGKVQKGLGDVQEKLQDTGDRISDEVDKHR